MTTTSLQTKVLDQLCQYLDRYHIPQRVLATHLGLTRSGVSRLLDGQIALTLDYLERLAFFLQQSPAELVAEDGALIQPTSPMEAALLTRFRRMTQAERGSLLTVLHCQPSPTRRRLKHPRVGAHITKPGAV